MLYFIKYEKKIIESYSDIEIKEQDKLDTLLQIVRNNADADLKYNDRFLTNIKNYSEDIFK